MRRALLSLFVFAATSVQGLSSDQIKSFYSDGYLVLEDFLTAEEVQDLRDEMSGLVSHFEPADLPAFNPDQEIHTEGQYFFDSADKISFFLEVNAVDENGNLVCAREESVNKVGHALHQLNPVFHSITYDDRVLDVCADLGIPDPKVIQSMYIFKQPRIGGQVPTHQDSTFVHTEPDTLLGFWIPLEDATVENGCLWVAPGEHVSPLRQLWVREGDKMSFVDLDETEWPEDMMIPLEVEAGSLVLIHGRVPHKSLPNTSERSRHAYTFHLMDASSDYPSTNWLQRSDLSE